MKNPRRSKLRMEQTYGSSSIRHQALMYLLQINIINAADVSGAGSSRATTMLDLLLKGGWVMIPLLLFSMLAVYAIMERWIVLGTTTRIPQRWLGDINAKVVEGDFQGASMLCEQKNYAIARIIKAGIEKLTKSPKSVVTVIENTAQIEIYKLEKNLALLGAIAGAAPMLGFLGTVTGMIRAFMAMAQEAGHVSPQLLSGGIYEAMVTTAAGLVVGIFANLGYNYLIVQIQSATRRIEYAANQFIELVQNKAA